jgi:hypothetical protein
LPFALISSSCSSNKIIDNDTLFNTTRRLDSFQSQVFLLIPYTPTKRQLSLLMEIKTKVEIKDNGCSSYAAD